MGAEGVLTVYNFEEKGQFNTHDSSFDGGPFECHAGNVVGGEVWQSQDRLGVLCREKLKFLDQSGCEDPRSGYIELDWHDIALHDTSGGKWV